MTPLSREGSQNSIQLTTNLSGAINLKEVNAATIAGWRVHLGWQYIAERRTEGSDIGDKWPGGFARFRLESAALLPERSVKGSISSA